MNFLEEFHWCNLTHFAGISISNLHAHHDPPQFLASVLFSNILQSLEPPFLHPHLQKERQFILVMQMETQKIRLKKTIAHMSISESQTSFVNFTLTILGKCACTVKS